jgi:CheY-like chemotaxis protein
LAITKRLAEIMGGTIGVTSDVGQGSTFWFTVRMPVCSLSAQGGPSALTENGLLRNGRESDRQARMKWSASRNVRISRGHVLIVEDNPTNQKVAALILSRAGLRVDVAGNGREAVESFRTSQYDLLLMDCQMPEMDGFEATIEIRALEPAGRRVPILALTANVLKGEREKCLDAGMDDYLPKPIRAEALLGKLEQWLPAKPDRRFQAAMFEEFRSGIDHLHEDGMTDEEIAELVSMARDRLCEFRVSLDRSVAEGDLQAGARIAHSVAGTTGTFSLSTFERSIRQLEASLKVGELDNVRRITPAVLELMDATTSMMNAHGTQHVQSA